MSIFPIHTVESAPEAARPILEGVQQKFGFVPNLMGAFAEAPATLEAYLTLSEQFDKSSLTATERQAVILAASVENECHYCVAAHTVVASMQQVPNDVVAALREGHAIPDARLEALRQFTVTLVENRGWATEEKIQAFLAAGFNRSQVLEVVLGVTFKTLSNYTNHLVDTPVDTAFAPHAWQSAKAS
ncbi:MAG: carboxymuconolactone decarboxylase family protein [Alphaproteobacteria bacterium]|jgi:uncharacterized peroxidase-related enzyme|nr:carboxymuconolactone decarboxylase family protein [Alphaproteobacteria bacterium]